MTVEGDLPMSTVDAIAEDLRERLSSLQNSALDADAEQRLNVSPAARALNRR
jgi:hypothetical protein